MRFSNPKDDAPQNPPFGYIKRQYYTDIARVNFLVRLVAVGRQFHSNLKSRLVWIVVFISMIVLEGQSNIGGVLLTSGSLRPQVPSSWTAGSQPDTSTTFSQTHVR